MTTLSIEIDNAINFMTFGPINVVKMSPDIEINFGLPAKFKVQYGNFRDESICGNSNSAHRPFAGPVD